MASLPSPPDTPRGRDRVRQSWRSELSAAIDRYERATPAATWAQQQELNASIVDAMLTRLDGRTFASGIRLHSRDVEAEVLRFLMGERGLICRDNMDNMAFFTSEHESQWPGISDQYRKCFVDVMSQLV